jgi:hypothetical protein
MPRAAQPVTFEDVIAATPDYYPDTRPRQSPQTLGGLKAGYLHLITDSPIKMWLLIVAPTTKARHQMSSRWRVPDDA